MKSASDSFKVMASCKCGLYLQVPSESEKVVVEQLFQRDAVVRQSQVTTVPTLDNNKTRV